MHDLSPCTIWVHARFGAFLLLSRPKKSAGTVSKEASSSAAAYSSDFTYVSVPLWQGHGVVHNRRLPSRPVTHP